jgi:hypothetical protein
VSGGGGLPVVSQAWMAVIRDPGFWRDRGKARLLVKQETGGGRAACRACWRVGWKSLTFWVSSHCPCAEASANTSSAWRWRGRTSHPGAAGRADAGSCDELLADPPGLLGAQRCVAGVGVDSFDARGLLRGGDRLEDRSRTISAESGEHRQNGQPDPENSSGRHRPGGNEIRKRIAAVCAPEA